MNYRWDLRKVDQPELVSALRRDLNDLPEALARALVLRGVHDVPDARRFFRAGIEELHDPAEMQDMSTAATRVASAIRGGERVLVYGDYDVDGVTSTVLMTDFLRSCGADATYFIPHRSRDGYGLGNSGIEYANRVGAGLIIALDCGITAFEPASYARELGIDLVICDHHTTGETLPVATAILNPKRDDCSYPCRELCGCGVGFKLVQGVLTALGRNPQEAARYLDLVAIATAADIVPVGGENRILLREGLKRIGETERVGLQALAEQARVDLLGCTTSQVVFGLAPRINAAGRINEASLAVDLLLEKDPDRATELAGQIEALNDERRVIDHETRIAAEKMAERHLSSRHRSGVVLHHPDWHPGVIGITASRIVERFYRPAVLLTTVNGIAKGSARSIYGINIYKAIEACSSLLLQFGGHDYAAGLSLHESNIDAFRNRFDEAVAEQMTPRLMTPAIRIDSDTALTDITTRFWAVLQQFEPFGPSNARPVFRASAAQLLGQPQTVGRDKTHLKFAIRPNGSESGAIRAIGFDLADRAATLRESLRCGRPVDLVFSVQENEWRGLTELQLRVKDVRLADEEGSGSVHSEQAIAGNQQLQHP